MEWLWILLIVVLIYIGVDYGRLIFKVRRLQQEAEVEVEYTPTRYIMIGSDKSQYITDLAMMDIQAHKDANIDIKIFVDNAEQGTTKVGFDNGDELIVYNYEKAQIAPLTQNEVRDYAQKIFFDYKLPEGAERAIIQQLGLLDYMVNIGICSEKSGGK